MRPGGWYRVSLFFCAFTQELTVLAYRKQWQLDCRCGLWGRCQTNSLPPRPHGRLRVVCPEDDRLEHPRRSEIDDETRLGLHLRPLNSDIRTPNPLDADPSKLLYCKGISRDGAVGFSEYAKAGGLPHQVCLMQAWRTGHPSELASQPASNNNEVKPWSETTHRLMIQREGGYIGIDAFMFLIY